MTTLRERCQAIEWLVLDVDGVLTGGDITYLDDQAEEKSFHVRDGSGLKLWSLAGKHAAIITGRNSPIVLRRARDMDVEQVFQGVFHKIEPFRGLLQAKGLAAAAMCCVGDDVPDLPLVRDCGLGVAVADACAEVRTAAHLVTRARGGSGAVREVVEIILRAQGLWQGLIDKLYPRTP